LIFKNINFFSNINNRMSENNNQEFYKPIYSIGSTARILDISVHTIRMYEKAGLILPNKEKGRNRLYSEKDIERIRCIRKEINENKYSISSIQKILSFIPCWREINCSEEARINCQAFNNGNLPCWTYKHNETKCNSLKCRACEVYNNFKCNNIKEKIIHYTLDKV
jgi:MerR family transcriptional regulator, heat shock protein HspR